MKTIEKYLNWIILVLLLFTLIRSCGVGTSVSRLDKKVTALDEKVETKVITKEEMTRMIKETPNWKTLEIEELSDKNKTPINFFKNDIERDTQK
jgi:hypothetical protein